MGYYDEDKEEWVCEDRCLEKEDGTYCGSTGMYSLPFRFLPLGLVPWQTVGFSLDYVDHLTSFALLLGGGNRECANTMDKVVLWLSVGFVAGALVFIAITVLLLEIRFQLAGRKQRRVLRSLNQRIIATQTPNM